MKTPTSENKILSILAVTMSGLALLLSLISIGYAIYNTYYRTPSNIKNYINSHKEELRGPKGDIGPQGFDGADGSNGRDGSNGTNSSNPTSCSTYNSGYGFGSVNCY